MKFFFLASAIFATTCMLYSMEQMEQDDSPDQSIVVDGVNIYVMAKDDMTNKTAKSTEIINEPFDINATTPNGNFALLTAAMLSQKSKDIIKILLERGANINQARQNDKWTPLHVACYYGYPESIGELVSRGASVNAINTNQQTPLALAIAASTPRDPVANTKALLDAIQKRTEQQKHNQ